VTVGPHAVAVKHPATVLIHGQSAYPPRLSAPSSTTNGGGGSTGSAGTSEPGSAGSSTAGAGSSSTPGSVTTTSTGGSLPGEQSSDVRPGSSDSPADSDRALKPAHLSSGTKTLVALLAVLVLGIGVIVFIAGYRGRSH
jgi:hypothetical protein